MQSRRRDGQGEGAGGVAQCLEFRRTCSIVRLMDDDPSPARVPTPKTAHAVALNAVRHGLRSVALVIPGIESLDEWESFSADALTTLSPEGAIEAALSERIIELLWRGRRVARAEQRLIVDEYNRLLAIERRERSTSKSIREELAENFYAGLVETEPETARPPLIAPEYALNPVVRYEAHLSRQLYRAMHELEALQAARNGRAATLVRVGIHGLPGG